MHINTITLLGYAAGIANITEQSAFFAIYTHGKRPIGAGLYEETRERHQVMATGQFIPYCTNIRKGTKIFLQGRLQYPATQISLARKPAQSRTATVFLTYFRILKQPAIPDDTDVYDIDDI